MLTAHLDFVYYQLQNSSKVIFTSMNLIRQDQNIQGIGLRVCIKVQLLFFSYIHMENDTAPLQTMYLSTIPNIKRTFSHAHSPLDVTDIKGARSRFIEHPRPQRQSSLNCYQLQKSHPKQLIPHSVNKPSFLLEVDDIVGTRIKVNKFTTTRQTNPLNPQYQTAKVEYIAVESPKFIRDAMAIDDIQGVRSRETFAIKLQRAGKTINTKEQIMLDIRPTLKGFVRSTTQPISSSLFVEDINMGDPNYAKKNTRQTNPLQPIYNVPGTQSYGFIEGSKRKDKIATVPQKESNSVKTEDIEGAKTKYNNFVCLKKDQVPGSKPQTLKRGVITNRKTDPLQPKYNYPGWSQVDKPQHFTRPRTAHQKFDQFLK